MPPTYDIILQFNHQIVTLQENFVRVYQQIKFPARLVDVCHVNIMFVVCVFFLVLSHVLIHFFRFWRLFSKLRRDVNSLLFRSTLCNC